MDLETISVENWRPITAPELRANLRRFNATEDVLLAGFIDAATRWVEARTKTAILGRRVRLHLPALPSSFVELPAPPLRYAANADVTTAVQSVEHIAEGASVWTTLPADVLRLVRGDQVWMMERGPATAPTLASLPRALRITYDVGYRDAAHLALEAPDLRDAIMLLASHRDVNREATVNESRIMAVSKEVEFGVTSLISHHVVRTRYTAAWV